jgi:hypothetical protein
LVKWLVLGLDALVLVSETLNLRETSVMQKRDLSNARCVGL